MAFFFFFLKNVHSLKAQCFPHWYVYNNYQIVHYLLRTQQILVELTYFAKGKQNKHKTNKELDTGGKSAIGLKNGK
jgi:hypothetical protein